MTARKEITMRTLSSVILILVCQLMSMYTYADTQELPELTDLAQLNLEIAKTEVVDEIQQVGIGKLAGTDDTKLIVVTLKGTAKLPCRFCIEAQEFAAVFEGETVNIQDKKEKTTMIKVSDAVGSDESWIFAREGWMNVRYFRIEKSGTVNIRVAFFLPKRVNNFSIRYPTLAKGKATISMQGNKKTQK